MIWRIKKPSNRKKPRGRKRHPLWGSLPLELKEIIMEYLEDFIQGEKVGSYAAVCKEWYNYFEPRIFQRLQLTPNRLDEFETLVSGYRREYVQHIWFRFERKCQEDEESFEFRHQMDHMRFTAAIFHLFQILSEWDGRDADQRGITLELSAFSAVDPRYSMKDTMPETLRELDLAVESRALNAVYEKTPQPIRRLAKNTRIDQATRVSKCYKVPHRDPLPAAFPSVELVRELVIRRQVHIAFFTAYLEDIIQALPSIEFMTYEPWRCLANNHNALEKALAALPCSIKGLHMYEDDPLFYTSHVSQKHNSQEFIALGRQMADLSQDKGPEALSLSFVIDAVHFFGDFRTPSISRPAHKLGWLNLTSLVLTSGIISMGATARITDLLCAAARAAQHMPKLQVMDLYNVDLREGAVFTYIHDSEGSLVHWESTWSWSIPAVALDAWKKVAQIHGSEQLDHSLRRITREELRWPYCIVSLLHTRETVVHPATYSNMMDGMNNI